MSHHTVTAALHYLVKLQVTAVDRGPRLQGSTRASVEPAYTSACCRRTSTLQTSTCDVCPPSLSTAPSERSTPLSQVRA